MLKLGNQLQSTFNINGLFILTTHEIQSDMIFAYPNYIGLIHWQAETDLLQNF